MQSLPIFVYGTLQRGEQREKAWPCQALGVEWATIRATLYDLGPYPAIVPGPHRILGELWSIAECDLPRTLSALDEIEGFAGRADDLYTRRVVESTTLRGEVRRAYAYFFANRLVLQSAVEVPADSNGLVHWRRGNRSLPNSDDRA